MSDESLTYRVQTASATDVQGHLRSCDRTFAPPLSARVDIAQYSEKIARRAATFEAWSGTELVGLVAAYFDDSPERSVFVTSVSVKERLMGRGIARALIRMCLARAQENGGRSVALEVSRDAFAAIELYRSHGFVEVLDKGATVVMSVPGRVRPASQ